MNATLSLKTFRNLASALLIGALMVMVNIASAQSVDPRVQIRTDRVQYQSKNTTPTVDAVGQGQTTNSWDDRFGYGKSGALNNWATMIASDDKGLVYAGGQFTKAGSVQTANRIGYWDGETWTSMADGLNGPVSSISIVGSDIYVGGNFSIAGKVTSTRNIARWDGEMWHPIGEGVPGLVTDIEFYKGHLYVSGWFENAGDQRASYIARWDGSNWNKVGAGVDGWVSSMTIYNDNLVIGGLFKQVYGVAGTSHIASWDGQKWSALGQGTNDLLLTVTTDGTNLYAGGAFTSASNTDGTSYIARWDGSKWSGLGKGLNDWVSAIDASNNRVVVGGWFTTGIDADNSTKSLHRLGIYDSASGAWTCLGNGVSYTVNKETVVLSVTQSKGSVYVAGIFNMTGNNPSIGFGRWIDNTEPTLETPRILYPSNMASVTGNEVELSWENLANISGYTVQISQTPDFNSALSISTISPKHVFDQVVSGQAYYWRVRANYTNVSGNWSNASTFTRVVATSLEDDVLMPGEFRLAQNYPNPFNPSTTIGFELSETTQVMLSVYSIDGRLITTLVNELRSAGSHTIPFNAAGLSSGVYVYRMHTPTTVITRTMTLIK